jgi:hypothetical protein
VNLPEASRNLVRDHRLSEFGIEINTGAPAVKIDQAKVFKKAGESPLRLQFVGDQSLQIVMDPLSNFDSRRCGELKQYASGQAEVVVTGEGNVSPREIIGDGFRLTILSGACRIEDSSIIFGYAFLHDSRRPGKIFDLSAGLKVGGIGCDFSDRGFFACDFDGALFFNRYLVVWSQSALKVAIYDIDQPELVWEPVSLPSLDVMRYLSLSHDLKSLVKLDRDGSFQVIQLTMGATSPTDKFTGEMSHPILLSGRVVDDEVAIWTPSGLFDSTPEGASHVAVRFAGRSGEYALEQFHGMLHVTDLLRRTLDGQKFDRPHAPNSHRRLT